MSRDGAAYDIPVDGEWVTVAVVAERGEVRLSGYKDASDSESEGDEKAVPAKSHGKTGKLAAAAVAGKNGQHTKRRRAKKYVNLRLAALPPRSSTAAGSTVAGDALLQLLLFEADHAVRQEGEGDKKTYKGGSGGAYERWCNLNPGDVIGLVNPKVLRPLKVCSMSSLGQQDVETHDSPSQAGSASPHPMTLPLALNPYSAESIFLIGKCRDLGQCTAIQKDGTRCTSWVDL
jgi:minichromosome maintenance protein 10